MTTVTVTTNDFAEDGAQSGLRAVIVQTMVRVRGQAVALAPTDTGQLRNSIMWRKGWGSDVFSFPQEGGLNEYGRDKQASAKVTANVSGDEGVVGSGLEYATYQEFGTRFMPAKPFMRIAADEVRGATAAQLANKWGPEAMAKEFNRRKVTRTTR